MFAESFDRTIQSSEGAEKTLSRLNALRAGESSEFAQAVKVLGEAVGRSPRVVGEVKEVDPSTVYEDIKVVVSNAVKTLVATDAPIGSDLYFSLRDDAMRRIDERVRAAIANAKSEAS